MTHGWVWSLGLVVFAALLAGALPGPSQRLAQELRERPGMTTLVGFLALTAIPVAAVMLVFTIIGIPIALLAMVLYAALLMIGYVWLAVVLGGLLLDRFNADLPPLKEFILPGGGPAAAACHMARTICRRAERQVWTLVDGDHVALEVPRYLNRLSDLLFVIARVLARAESGSEVLWRHERDR